MNDTNVKQITENIWRRAERPLGLPFAEQVDGGWWWGILAVVLAVAFVYVVLMYIRDGHSIGWIWGGFLALCRCSVYGILAVAFMMPAQQTWHEIRKESRVIYLVDITDSMGTRDEVPRSGGRIEDIPTRQDYVLKLLTDEKTNFLKRTLETNPVFAYRFGRFADENFLVFEKDGVYWTREQWDDRARPRPADEPAPQGNPLVQMDWQTFLKPSIKDDLDDKMEEAQRKQVDRLRRMRSGTNIGDSVMTVLNRELNNMVQGIVIFTDGRNTEGARQAITDVSERAKKAQIPVFVVAVGEDRPPIRIDIADVRSPDTARPDDPFKISVSAQGVGLANEDVTIFLDMFKPGDDKKPFQTVSKTVKFKPGQPPRAEEEFEITPEAYGEDATEQAPAKPDKPAKPEDKKPDDKKPEEKPASGKTVKELPEGTWKFVARIPRNNQEPFAGTEHKSDPVEVKVVRRPLRVLMFASGPTRDYQFIRTLMVREVDKGRVELCIHLQAAPGQDVPRTGRVQDVPPNRMLMSFPSQLKDDKDVADGEDKFNNLGSYDLILAFDPDWTRLEKNELKNVEKWVENGGGMIVVAGPIHTLELSKPGIAAGGDREKLKPVLDLYPVILEDARIKDLERKTDDPYRLNFPGANDEMEFLRLNEELEKANFRSSWEEFFTGVAKAENPKAVDPSAPLRGFYNYYPVKRAKDKAVVIATFSDPQAALPDGKEMPYLVTSTSGKGRVVWVGSGETWRLRQYREAFHERFWTKLARFAGSGNVGKLSQRIEPNMGQIFPANTYVTVEAKFLDRELQPIPRVSKPEIRLELPAGIKDIPTNFTLTPRSAGGSFDGWFSTRFLVKSPGEYKITFESPETKESITKKFLVKESNPELDNTRPDFDLMYDLASEADDALGRISDPARKREVLAKLLRPVAEKQEGAAKDPAREKAHLLFDVKSADLIPSCMSQQIKEERNKGQVKDRWDVWWVLALVVGILGVEWLTRKLLRLA
jgi:uncharacterized membrane protein